MFVVISVICNIIMSVAVVLMVGYIIRKPIQAITQQVAWHRGPKRLKTGSDKSACGIVFGRDKLKQLVFLPAEHEGHVAVIGGTGSGKTTAILLPTLCHWPGTSFTIDISGDIHTSVNCKNKLLYAPGNSESVPYDVFGLVDNLSPADQDEALAQLAHLLLPDTPDASSNAQYFISGGRKILTATLIAYYHQGVDFVDICRTILSNGYQSLFSAIDKSGNLTATMYISGFEGNSPQNISGCKDTCDDAIRLFGVNPRIWASVRRPNPGETAFVPQSVETHNVFVALPDAKLAVYASLLRIITAQVLAYLSDRPKGHNHSILLCLDEFASLGKMEITPALRKLRKQHVRIIILTQSIADIEDVYGRDRHKVMIDNCSYIAILRATEPGTEELIAKMIGREYKLRESVTTSNLGAVISKTRSLEKDYIIAPADLAHLGDNLILLHPDGHMTLTKAYNWKS